MALLLEAEQQGLMNGDYVFFLVQHFEVSGSVVSKNFTSLSYSCTVCPKLRFYMYKQQPADKVIDDPFIIQDEP